MNDDNFSSQKMMNCLYKVAIKLSHEINPTPDIDELVNMTWLRCGRHFKGGLEGIINLPILHYNMLAAYFGRGKGKDRNSGITGSGMDWERTTLYDNIGKEDMSDIKFDAKEDIEYYLSKLKPKNRRIVEMRYLEGRTYESIGEELGRTKQAIKQAIDRSIKKMSPIKAL